MQTVENPHKRKKQPELVRRALLDEAAKLAIKEGLGSVTVQAVANAAGVTKGGFIHHFPSKQALIDTLFQELLDSIDADLDKFMADDPEPTGRLRAPIWKQCSRQVGRAISARGRRFRFPC